MHKPASFCVSLEACLGGMARSFLASLAFAAPIVAGLGLLAALPARAAFSPPAEGARLAVATDHSEATRAALDALGAGGNAVDGAIAAALTLGVVNPTASGLGGGGFALVYTAQDRKVTAVDFREVAPAKLNAEALSAHPRFRPEDSATRGASVGVPGEPAGLEWLSRRFAKRSLAADAAYAVGVAGRGVPLSKHTAEVVARMREHLAASRELSAALLPGGNPLPYLANFRRPELARTLARFGAEGSRPFYSGDIAMKIVEAARSAGGGLEPGDLTAYRVRERVPLSRAMDGQTFVTMPAPSAGGLMLLETVTMFGGSPSSPLKGMGLGSSAYLHTLAEGMRGAIADRVRLAGDPDLDPGVTEGGARAHEASQMAARRKRIEPTRTHPAPEFRTREQGTSHLIVADADGNVVTLTTTINAPVGARLVAGDTGIWLNDEMDDFSSPPDVAGFGVIGLGPNRPRAGARPVSSMMPTLVLQDGLPVLAAGGSGGTRIATGVTQAVLARLVFGVDVSAAVSAPRVHVSGASAELLVDADVTEDVRSGLRQRGEGVKEETYGFSALEMVAWDRTPRGVRITAASDPRKQGFAAAQ